MGAKGEQGMKALAGSVVILAGAVLGAGGTVANALMLSANRGGEIGVGMIVAGVGLGIIGLAVLVLGLAPDRGKPNP
jgi:drug/metabolite transporter (DMT)-like permease